MRSTQTERHVRWRLVLGVGATLIGCGLTAAAARPAWRAAVWAQVAPSRTVAVQPIQPSSVAGRPSQEQTPPPVRTARAPVGDQRPVAVPAFQPLVEQPIAAGAEAQITSEGQSPAGPEGRYRSYVTDLAHRYMSGDRDAGAAMLHALAHPGEVPEPTVFLRGSVRGTKLRLVEAQGRPIEYQFVLDDSRKLAVERETYAVVVEAERAALEAKLEGAAVQRLVELTIDFVGQPGEQIDVVAETEADRRKLEEAKREQLKVRQRRGVPWVVGGNR